MIGLLAADPRETEQLRQQLQRQQNQTWTGRLGRTEVVLSHSGVGKSGAAATATELILRHAPQALILFGCAGAYPKSGLAVGDLALASEEIFGDEGCLAPEGFLDLEQLGLPSARAADTSLYNRIPLGPPPGERLLKVLRSCCADRQASLYSGPFVTVSTCSGTTAAGLELVRRTGGLCENMEGAAVALACSRHGIPLLELRGISNLVEDRDTERWDLPGAVSLAQAAVRQLLQEGWPEEPPR